MSARPGDGQERGVPHPAHRQMDRDQSAGAAKQCSKIEPGPASIQVLLHTAEACCMEGREDCSINRPVRHGAAGRRRANLVRTTREKAGFSCPALLLGSERVAQLGSATAPTVDSQRRWSGGQQQQQQGHAGHSDGPDPLHTVAVSPAAQAVRDSMASMLASNWNGRTDGRERIGRGDSRVAMSYRIQYTVYCCVCVCVCIYASIYCVCLT